MTLYNVIPKRCRSATAAVQSTVNTDAMNSASSGEPRENEVEEINDSSVGYLYQLAWVDSGG